MLRRMDEAISRRLGRWFGTVALNSKPPDAVSVMLTELVEMLDALNPSRLDPSRSMIRSSDHGWVTPAQAVEVHLGHDIDNEADIDVVVGNDEALVSWLPTHEHVYPDDGSEERPWPKVVVDLLAAVLSGEYLVESHYRGHRLVKSRLLDALTPTSPELSTTGSLFGWLRWWGERRVEVRRLDYGVRPQQTPSSSS
jgi:hypothetical protein